jgi:hypothetical protein
MRQRLVAAIFLVAGLVPLARAAEPVLLARAVPTAITVPNYPDCPWPTELAGAIVEEASGAAALTDLAPAAVPGRFLALEVVALHPPGGSGPSGSRWIRVRGELLEGGKVLTSFEMQYITSRAKATPCATAQSLAEAMATRVAKWIREHGSLPKAELQALTPPALAATPEWVPPVIGYARMPLNSPLAVAFRPYDGAIDSQQAVHDAIVASAGAQDWTITEQGPGRIVVAYLARKRQGATVAIDYDLAGFRLVYLHSEGLGYSQDEGRLLIHPDYYSWTGKLAQEIEFRTRRL